ncbi:MAG TPA: SH3 domain-containing protein [Coriobacteriia bacterium]|nr:SH3 domain-containing protein [Coriobacteriia bacterium]
MSGMPGVVRGALGVVVLVALLIVVNGWWREYREDGASVASPSEATQTPDAAPGSEAEAPPAAEEAPAEAPQPSGQEVVVLIEGLNFREEPSRDGELIRGLGRGTRLTHLQTADGWHRVKDADGVEGYVSANPQYTEIE